MARLEIAVQELQELQKNGRLLLTRPASAVQWVIVVACAFVGFALTYYVAPDVRRPIRSVSAGALAATPAWLLFTLVFSGVLNQFGALLVDPLYGWFTGLIVLLLYLYWSALILLAGAEINRVIEADRTDPGGGIGCGVLVHPAR